MTRTRWIIFILICLGILGMVAFSSKKDLGTSFKGDATKVITESPVPDYVFGDKQAKVVLVEYGDYECPGCESLYPVLKSISVQYKDKIAFVFRELPLTTIHPNALAAATAAEAAGLQGKYYEYHDLLYDNQNFWNQAPVSERGSLFEGYAKRLDLDVNKFKADLTNKDVTAKINRDRSTAASFGLTSTPSLLLNGQKLSQDVTFDKDKLSKAINDELTKAGVTPPVAQPSTTQ